MKLRILVPVAVLMTMCWGCSFLESGYQKNLQATVLAEEAVKHVKAGHHEKALFALNHAFAIAKTITDEGGEEGYQQTNALSKIALKCIEAGFYNQALRVANTIKIENIRSYTLSKIVEYHTRTLRYNQAVALANTLKRDSIQSGSSIESISNKNPKIQQYNQFLAVANNMSDSTQKATQMTHLAVSFLNIKQTNKGLQILAQALNIARTANTKDEQQALALSEIAIIYAQLGQYNQALTVINLIKNYHAIIKTTTVAYINRRQHSHL